MCEELRESFENKKAEKEALLEMQTRDKENRDKEEEDRERSESPFPWALQTGHCFGNLVLTLMTNYSH